jgi:2-oxo-4-hydroxy-4-carboxy--5-ureidoimidazoline (OHCU) decarboxylase
MGIQSFFLKRMLKSKMKGVPEAQQKQILAMVERHPDFFKKIGEEVEKRKKSGQNETVATMQVMREHQSEFQKLMQ